MSRWLIVLPIMVGAVALGPSASVAGPGFGGGQGSGGQVNGVLTAGVTFSGGGSSGGGDGCVWTLIDGELGAENNGQVAWPRVKSGVVYHLWGRECPGQAWAVYEVPETTPRDLLPIALRRLQERALPRPEPVFELLDPEFGWAYVRTPLDFRAGGDSWRPVSVTARIGPIWATVTAAPQTLTFDPGDPAGPGPVICGGDGPVAAYLPESPGACSYTYVNASSTSPYDGYHFLTTLTIDWTVSWTSSTGAGGPLASFQSSSTAELAVAEVHGVVVCTGSRPEQGGC